MGERFAVSACCELEVDEAGPGDLDRFNEIELSDQLDERTGQVPRRPSELLGQTHGHIAREVAMARIARALDLGIGCPELGPALGLGELAQGAAHE